MRIRVTSAAKADLSGALRWYRRRRPGLDHEFLRAFDQSLEAIQEHPSIGPVVDGSVRRHLLRGFPYAVFYLVGAGEIVVIGCMHGARAPVNWSGSGPA